MGFTVFALAYLYTVFAIIVDIRKRAEDYDEKIADAQQQMLDLGMQSKMADINAALQLRLKGISEDDGADDQLMGEAMKLSDSQFR